MRWFTILVLIGLQWFTIKVIIQTFLLATFLLGSSCYAIQIGTMNVPDNIYASTHKWCDYYKVDTKLALALACQESSWRQSCMGGAGEVGVYQIMLGTVQMYNYGKTSEEVLTRYDLDDNCRLGVWYLKRKIDEFKGDWVKAIATYNCGSSNVNWWWEIDVTRMHVTKVMIHYGRLNGDKL